MEGLETMSEIDNVKLKYQEAYNFMGFGNLEFTNYKKAFELYKELADEGYGYASFMIGVMMCKGLGTDKDIENGREVIKKAAQNGAPPAIIGFVLGDCIQEQDWKEYVALLKSNGFVSQGVAIEQMMRWGYDPITGNKINR